MSKDSFQQLIRLPSYMRLWFARLSGTMGSQMLMVAVGWQMCELISSAWDLDLLGLFQFLPVLLLTLVAGHVADRLHRGRIIACCFALQTLIAVLLITASVGWGAVMTAVVLTRWRCRVGRTWSVWWGGKH